MSIPSLVKAVLKPSLQQDIKFHLAWTVLRVVVGLMMIHNGLDKLGNVESFSRAYVEVIGLPFPIFFSYLAGYTELIAAPLVALGLLTRPAAFGLFGTMTVAYLSQKSNWSNFASEGVRRVILKSNFSLTKATP